MVVVDLGWVGGCRVLVVDFLVCVVWVLGMWGGVGCE